MHYLVTGGAGFIGSIISKKLLFLGNKVTIIDNLSTGKKSNIPSKANFVEGDLSKLETIEKLNNKKFHAILHISGQSSGEISFENPIYDLNSNTVSTLLLLDYALKTKCNKFIYASSMSVYGEQRGKDQFSETDKLNPKSFYAVGKLASENYLKIYNQQYGINYTILRYFNVYGPGQDLDNLKQGMVSIYLSQFLNNKFKKVLVKGSKNRFRDFCYIDDVVNITIKSINDKRFNNEVINVGTGKKTTVREVILEIKKYLSTNKPVIFKGSTPGDQHGIYANVDKIKYLTKFKFTNFNFGLKKMIEWIRLSQKQ
jgi:UDP-glucose 4-epimerase